MDVKRCRGCARELAVSEFHRSSRSADGLQARCKGCGNEHRRQRLAHLRAATLAALSAPDGKQCPRCGEMRLWEEFHRNAAAKDGRQAYCKPCAADLQRAYVARNAEAIALRQAEKLAKPIDATGSKTCNKCGEAKPLLSFYAHRGTKDGRATYCADCQRAATRQWGRDNAERKRQQNASRPPEKVKRDHRQFWLGLYGLTQESYAEMLAAQDGVCAICQQPERYIDKRTGEPRKLSVDHSHVSGRVRGLLCGRCNRGIGQFADDPAQLVRAAEYLRAALE